MKTNIIIGRFHCDTLTAGHHHLINESLKKRPKATLVFLIGDRFPGYTNKNPLPTEARRKMLKFYYPDCIVHTIYDNPSDKEWSNQVDTIAWRYKNPVLFGSRDSFIPKYHGSLKCVGIKELPNTCATDRRKHLAKVVYNSHFFRAGVIHAVENRFPTAYPTVDIAVLKTNQTAPMSLIPNGVELLLGRKPGKTKFCFIGGFVDPTDSCLEVAAGRELSEEVPGIITHEMKYVGSMKIDDFRYKGTKDGIITSLFTTYVMGGSIKAGDDIEEVKFFDLVNFDMSVLTEYHHPLFEMLKKHLKL